MLMDGYLVCKDFNEEILVDGINMYEPDTTQYCLYTLVSGNIGELPKDSKDNKYLLIFPFQCGIKFGNGYHFMNIRDCIGYLPYDDIIKAYKGEL